MNPQNQQSINPTQPINQNSVTPTRNWYKLILFVLLGLITFGGLIFAGMQIGKKQLVSENQNIKQPVITITQSGNNQTAQPIIDSNWKTYTSTKASYSFAYPPEWPLVDIPPSQGCTVCIEHIQFTSGYNPNSGDNTIAVILISKEDRIKTLEDYVNIHVKGDESKINLQNTMVGNEKAIAYTLSGGIPTLPIIEHAVVKNGLQYIIRLEDSIETNKNKTNNIFLFNQFLATFKFN